MRKEKKLSKLETEKLIMVQFRKIPVIHLLKTILIIKQKNIKSKANSFHWQSKKSTDL